MAMSADVQQAVPGWVTARRGLGHAEVRLSGGSGRIAYLGASVTAQRDGYRPRLHARLEARHGHAHQPVVAAFGAIGSAGAVFLADDLVVSRAPDLCLVELTTTDVAGHSPLPAVGPAIEGVLRKLAAVGCATCIVHLHRADLEVSPASPVVRAYEQVAEHYGVPTLNLGWHVAREVRAGRLSLADHYRDQVHETAQGAAATAEWLGDAVGRLLDAPAEPPAFPAPLHPTHAQHTRIVAVDPGTLERGRFRFNYDFVRLVPGQEVEARVEGTVVGALVVVGPRAGIVEVATPDVSRRYALFDEWCHVTRLSTLLFEQPIDGQPVRIRVTDDRVDHAVCPGDFAGKGEHAPCLDLVGLLVRYAA
jgi:hypothetical protein